MNTGLPAHLTIWLAYFLAQRVQTVRYPGTTSNLQPLNAAVPQGTGNENFLLPVSHKCRTNGRFSPLKYVDDYSGLHRQQHIP